MKKAAIFVDVQNIYYTTKQAYSRQFNYRKLWKLVSDEFLIESANAYAIQSSDDKQIKFQDALRHIGFAVRLKPFIQRSDGSAKGDWDVGITIDILETVNSVDTIILLSGDGDFDLLLKKINQKVQTLVYGVPELTARSLIESSQVYRKIDESLLLG